MGSICPEFDFPASEARNTASATMYHGSTNRFSDWVASAASRSSSTERPLDPALQDVLDEWAFHGAGQDGVRADAVWAPARSRSIFVNPLSPHLVVK